MPRVHFTEPAGTTVEIDVEAGHTVMEAAVQNGVEGIIGECGGSLTCATCHVYVEQEWLSVTGKAGDYEGELLDGALAPRLPESRLSCQIEVDDDLDGLLVRVPPEE